MLANYLIDTVYANKRFIDFGISTEQGGTVLNEGLIKQKEGFGGRAVVYDTYELEVYQLKLSTPNKIMAA